MDLRKDGDAQRRMTHRREFITDLLPAPRFYDPPGGPPWPAKEFADWLISQPFWSPSARLSVLEIEDIANRMCARYREGGAVVHALRHQRTIAKHYRRLGLKQAAKVLDVRGRGGPIEFRGDQALVSDICTLLALGRGNRRVGAWSTTASGKGGPLARVTEKFLQLADPDRFDPKKPDRHPLPSRKFFDDVFKRHEANRFFK